ncbi:MAG: hypothetical protein ACTSU2_11480 [Promethearchaeota archaeon]
MADDNQKKNSRNIENTNSGEYKNKADYINFNKFKKEVLRKISPDEHEIAELNAIIERTKRVLEEFAHKLSSSSHTPNKPNTNLIKVDYNFILPQGSTGLKQTQLKEASDIDLFIFLEPKKVLGDDFDYKNFYKNYKSKALLRKKIERIFKTYCNQWIIPALMEAGYRNVILSYADHPYVSASYKNYDIDVVLAFIVEDDAIKKFGPITAVDRTYHHTEFIRKNMTDEQRDDVRFLKYFLKYNLCYGDKSPIGNSGFIGYAIELMVLWFKDVYILLENFEELPHIPIDFFHRSEEELRQNERIKYDFLLIMDPTDLNRNVASSISKRTYLYILSIIKKYLSTRDPKSLFNTPINTKILGEDNSYLLNYLKSKINIAPLRPKSDEVYVTLLYFQNNNDHYTKYRDKLYSLARKLTKYLTNGMKDIPKFPDVNYSVYFEIYKQNAFRDLLDYFVKHNISGSLRSAIKDRIPQIDGEQTIKLENENWVYVLTFYSSRRKFPKYYEKKGPRANNKLHASRFIAKHPKAYKKNGFYYIQKSYKHNNFTHAIRSFIEHYIFGGLNLISIIEYTDSLKSTKNYISDDDNNNQNHPKNIIIPFEKVDHPLLLNIALKSTLILKYGILPHV